MWIIFYAGKPCFWLSGGEIYRAGKQNCHVNIENDSSISRTHLSFEVGLTTLQKINSSRSRTAGEETNDTQPASLTLIDSSTYGTTVSPGVAVSPRPSNHTSISNGDAVRKDSASSRAPDTSGEASALPPEERDTGIVGLRYTARRAEREAARAGRPHKRSREPGTTPGPETTDVVVVGEHHELVKGTPFRVPVDRPEWQEFSVKLGRRGATLTFLWVDIRVLVCDVDVDLHTKLEHHLNRCGARLLASEVADAQVDGTTDGGRGEGRADGRVSGQPEADFVVSDVLRPAPEVLSALLRGCPVVRPAYFADVLHRSSPQVPLPDPYGYVPPRDKAAWKSVLKDNTHGEGEEEDNLDKLLSVVQPQRQRMFLGLTFVVFQRELFAFMRNVLPSGGGRVLWDESLLSVVNDRTRQAILGPFALRHQRHIVLYAEDEAKPFRGCLSALQEELGLCCVTQREVLRSIVRATSLALPNLSRDDSSAVVSAVTNGTSAPPNAASTSASARPSAGTAGRPTDADPVFPSLNLPLGEVGDCGIGGLVDKERLAIAGGRQVDEEGWTTWGATVRAEGPEEPVRKSRRRSSGAGADHPVTPASAMVLPAYPCFESARSPGASGSSQALKPFRKQPQRYSRATTTAGEGTAPGTASGGIVELDWGAHARQMAADLMTSRVPAIDADTILPSRTDLVGAGARYGRLSHGAGAEGGRGGSLAAAAASAAGFSAGGDLFNAFDTAAHHAMQRKKATKAAPTGRGGRKGKAAAAAAESRTTTLLVPGTVPPATASAATLALSGLSRAPGATGAGERQRRGSHGAYTGNGIAIEGDEVESPPEDPTGARGGQGGGAFNIFDIEGIF